MGRDKENPRADCYCFTCDRWFHHNGIAMHRRGHLNRGESCEIEFSDGRVECYNPVKRKDK